MQIQHITRKDGEKMTVEVKFFTRDLENSWGVVAREQNSPVFSGSA